MDVVYAYWMCERNEIQTDEHMMFRLTMKLQGSKLQSLENELTNHSHELATYKCYDTSEACI